MIMNNTFSLKRFALYALKHYWENRVFYLLVILASALAVLFISTELTIFPFLKENYRDPSYQFNMTFIIVGILFTTAVLGRSLSGLKDQNFKMNSMLLPVSFQERFWFIIFNSIVVSIVVYLSIFYSVISYVETLYYYGEGVFLFKGLIPISTDLFIGVTFDNLETRDIFSLANLFQYDSFGALDFFGFCMIILSAYLYYISVIIYGVITLNRVKSYRVAITLLAHIAVIGVLIALLIYIGTQVTEDQFSGYYYGLHVAYSPSIFRNEELIFKLTPILLIFPLVNLFVSWKKIKTLEIYK